MTDPAKSIEVEDVLSSIRRIVTDDSEGAAERSESPSPKAPERFVLTPALRVPHDVTVTSTDATSGPLALGAFRTQLPEAEQAKDQRAGVEAPEPIDAAASDARQKDNDALLLQATQRVDPVSSFADDPQPDRLPTAAPEADDPAQIDPDLLRDMVAEMVRQELQGVLGERITRNVHKLVRREINRAMAAKDFD